MTRSDIAALIVAIGLGLPAACFAADDKPAEGFAAASRLAQAGQTEQALRIVDTALKTRPRDAQWRFLQGSLLSQSQRRSEAIAVFTALTEEFPNLPEPHNNLAVLLAANGQVAQARVSLEAALRADPAYGVAHENLGDVNLRLSLQAYQRALASGGDTVALTRKIKQLRQILDAAPAAEPARPR